MGKIITRYLLYIFIVLFVTACTHPNKEVVDERLDQKLVEKEGQPNSLLGAAFKNESFTDLTYSQWAKESITYLTERGTIAGLGNGKFGPTQTITRAQAVTYLVRELYPTIETGNPVAYQDIPTNHYFYKEIAIGSEKGLIGGFPDQTFRPNEPISRAETTALLTRAYQITNGIESVELIDIEQSWAKDSIALLASQHLVGGYTDKSFRPTQSVTRAEFAVFLSRIIHFKRAEAIAKQDWNTLIGFMTLNEKVGQMLMPDIPSWNGESTVKMNEGMEEMIQNHHLGGVILFEKNIVSNEQLTTFNYQLQQETDDIPLFIGIDQEGGVIKRIPNGTNLPGAMALGATENADLSYQAGKLTGTELKALGINVNFAPVLDVNNNPNNPIIGIRSFGEDPDLVSSLGMAFMNGLNDSGVIPVVKHFPGHGDTTVDSHLALPVLPHNRERLEEVELKPFQAAITNDVAMIMVAHIAFPAIDATEAVSKKDGSRIPIPATLSKEVLQQLLRAEMGYEGIIISDAFTMNAISEHFGDETAVKMAVSAGIDIILMPNNTTKAYDAILSAVGSGEIDEERIDKSVQKILRLKYNYGLFEQKPSLANKIQEVKQIVGSTKHRDIEKRISNESITLLKNEANHVPYMSKEGDKVTIIAEKSEHAKKLKTELLTHEPEVDVDVIMLSEVKQATLDQVSENSDFVILATYQFRNNIVQYKWDQIQLLVDKLNQRQKKYVHLSLGNPYDLLFLEEVKTSIAAYGGNQPNIEASINVIVGNIEAQGKLPVSLR